MNMTNGIAGCVFPAQAQEKPRGVIVDMDDNLLSVVEAAIDLSPGFWFACMEVQDEFGLALRPAKDKTYAALRILADRGNAKAADALKGFHDITGG